MFDMRGKAFLVGPVKRKINSSAQIKNKRHEQKSMSALIMLSVTHRKLIERVVSASE